MTPLQGLTAAAGTGTTVTYQQGLPTDASLPAIPAADLSPAYSPTGFGGSYSGTLTAPETGTYVLALQNSCGCYTSTTLSVDGREILNDPGTPPVSIYSASVQLQAGQTYTIAINGDSSALTWGTPSALAPGVSQAVAAAKSAATAVVVVSDDTVTLQPGQSAEVSFVLDSHDLSCWNQSANGWVVPSGAFQVYVGDSSALANLPLRGGFTVTAHTSGR